MAAGADPWAGKDNQECLCELVATTATLEDRRRDRGQGPPTTYEIAEHIGYGSNPGKIRRLLGVACDHSILHRGSVGSGALLERTEAGGGKWQDDTYDVTPHGREFIDQCNAPRGLSHPPAAR